MDSLERVSSLLFELSNSTRLSILLDIQANPSKLSSISQRIDISIQETSRHLARLVDVCFIEKKSTGIFQTTPLGDQICSLLPMFQILADNREYFTSHSLSVIPKEFTYGLGELLNSGYTDHVMESFRQIGKLISEASEFIWILSDQVLSSSLPLIEEAMSRGCRFRVILPTELHDVADSVSDYPQLGAPAHAHEISRHLETVELILIVSENETLVCFPTCDGKIDYHGFSMTSSNALEWAKNMYEYFWSRAEIM